MPKLNIDVANMLDLDMERELAHVQLLRDLLEAIWTGQMQDEASINDAIFRALTSDKA